MFFSKSARILATLALVLGLLRILMGAYIARIEPNEAYDAAVARYLGGQATGQVIDEGIYIILFAIALGTLAEISFSLRKRSE